METPEAVAITLIDAEDSDEYGVPHTHTMSIASVIGYLDGPVRRDLSDPQFGEPEVDEAISLVRAGQIKEANAVLRPLGIRLSA